MNYAVGSLNFLSVDYRNKVVDNLADCKIRHQKLYAN